VKDLMTGGYQVVTALAEAHEKYGLLAEAGYVAARTVLTGGPLKSVALGLARVAEGELIAQASSVLSSRVDRTINEFVTGMGWTADVRALGTSVHLGAQDFGQLAGMLGGTVVDTLFGAGIDQIGKRAGAMSQVVDKAARDRFRRGYDKAVADRGEIWQHRPGLDERHHVVAFDHPENRELAARLKGIGVDIHNPAINGVSLPKNSDIDNPFGKIPHSETKSGAYYQYIDRSFRNVTTQTEAVTVMKRLQMELLSGVKKW
jgi:hypothetical protein